MELPDNLMNHIVTEAKRVHHGKIIIEINESADKVDVVTEHRERFLRKKPEKKFRNG